MDKKHNTITFHAPDLSTRQELPVAGGAVKAGFPSPADDFLDSPLDLNRELVHNPASTFFVRVSGDSMAGDGIGDGDLLVVDRSVEPYDGCIAVCYVDGEFTVKRVRLEKGCAWLMPSNPKYRPIRVDAENDFQIWASSATSSKPSNRQPCTGSATATTSTPPANGFSGPIWWDAPS